MSKSPPRADGTPQAGAITPAWRPQQVEKTPPCQAACPNCGDIRGWIGAVAQRRLTGLSRKDGWGELERVMVHLERRVYLLTPELRQRFALERVPAVVEAVGSRFRVTETAMVGQKRPEVTE